MTGYLGWMEFSKNCDEAFPWIFPGSEQRNQFSNGSKTLSITEQPMRHWRILICIHSKHLQLIKSLIKLCSSFLPHHGISLPDLQVQKQNPDEHHSLTGRISNVDLHELHLFHRYKVSKASNHWSKVSGHGFVFHLKIKFLQAAFYTENKV